MEESTSHTIHNGEPTMSLTFGAGPLAAHPPKTVNYRLESPAHALFMHPFARRVRALREGKVVLDTDRGFLLHETGLQPVLYAPVEDFAEELLTPTDHTTHCPFKGDASYHSLTVGETTVDNAVWSYPDPTPEALWLRGLASLYWDAADTWLDEDERVRGHLRDPYHRVDVRSSTRLVRVALGDTTLALTSSPKVLSETGLPNRLYIPLADVHQEYLAPSRTRTHCPYKGDAVYHDVRVGGTVASDAAWSYRRTLKDGYDVRDHVCFLHDDLTVTEELQP
ncbi:DUF427 domain-containing protein [Nocardiopsis ansamitocini]|uniref:DUF427 domain-containing protein n=1 Tax=Nocardiopsis ansamitocini TaxID=1670832 RepID=A0A9W6P5W3_9ACTN|nr:DUF427 domain-containing protein [Nocardiopsis ansamitocini]GLU47999.1 hypothetical protein Nans01_23500 [Nocardiopsis ansamitocini]